MQPSHSSRPISRRVGELIGLGRDREAAELGVEAAELGVEAAELGLAHSDTIAEARSGTRGGPMDVLEQLDQLGPVLALVVGGIRSDQLDNPTPCAKFTVRGVLDHMIGGATAFSAAFRGVAPRAADTTDVLASFGPTLAELSDAMHSPGALDRTIQAPFGEVPGTDFARFVVLDGLVHGWDLATSTGQPYAPPDALVVEVDAFARRAVDPLRDGDTFAAAVEPAAAAAPIERLAAFTGRRL